MRNILCLTLLLATLALAGCGNTWRGIGQDVQRVGGWMQGR